MEQITTLISSMGFPITVSLVAFWFIYQILQQERQDRKEEQATHKQEVDALRATMDANNAAILAALNASTAAINRLADKLDNKEV